MFESTYIQTVQCTVTSCSHVEVPESKLTFHWTDILLTSFTLCTDGDKADVHAPEVDRLLPPPPPLLLLQLKVWNCSWSGLGNGQCEWNAAHSDLLTAPSVKRQWISVSEHRWNEQASVSSGVEVRPGAGWAIYSRNSRTLFYFWGMNSDVRVKSQPWWRSWRADLWRGRHSGGQKKWKWMSSVQWDS